jgi:2,4-diaminopentanoate dehydrogenase
MTANSLPANNSGTSATPYRVVQWATGTIGLRALRGIIEHPELDLAGVYVHSPEKVGRDAGELCGLAPKGVSATGAIEDILALDADCVLYMPLFLDVDEVCRLLASGANIVTTCGKFHHPDSMDAALRSRIDEACRAGASSIHSTGSSPGFISEAIPLVLTSIQRQLTSLTIDEFANMSQRDSPEMMFDLMGFGRPMAPFEEFRADYLKSSFGPSLHLVADAIGLPLDSLRAHGELAAARSDTDIAAGRLKSGTVAAQRITVEGVRDGRTLLSFRATWYCTGDVEPSWDIRPTGWRVVVDGDAPLDVDIKMPVSLDDMAAVSPGYTANRAVNLAAAVCAAAPGVNATTQLPPAAARLNPGW